MDEVENNGSPERTPKWKEKKRALRRNVRLRLKEGLYEDLRETPKKHRRDWDQHDNQD